MITIEDLTEKERREFFSEVRRPHAHKKRRQEIADRVAIQADDFDHIIRRRIQDVYHDPEIAGEVAKWAIGLFNPQKVAVRRIAVGYKRRPLRRLKKQAGNTEKLTALYRRVRFAKFAQRWHSMSVATNRILVLAEPLRDRKGPTVGFRYVTGANAEVFEEPGTTTDHPPAVLGILLPTDEAGTQKEQKVMTVDARWYAVWGEHNKLEMAWEHGLGRFPGAWMDHNDCTENDVFNGIDGRGMTKTTAEVGFIAASMGWTRKSQCRKLLTLVFDDEETTADGDGDGAPDGQVLHDPEAASILTGSVQMLVNDMNTAVSEFLSHIDQLDRRAFEQLTGAPAPPNPALMQNPAAAANQLHAASSEAHANIIDGLSTFEDDMAEVVVGMAARLGMPDVPPVEAVRDRFEAQFLQLPFLETPTERAEIWKRWIGLGVGTAAGFYAELHGTSEEEGRERVLEMQKWQAEFNDVRSARHVQADGNLEEDPGLAGESDDQKTGRFGGRAAPAAEDETA